VSVTFFELLEKETSANVETAKLQSLLPHLNVCAFVGLDQKQLFFVYGKKTNKQHALTRTYTHIHSHAHIHSHTHTHSHILTYTHTLSQNLENNH
jgi:hypothetical protein